MERRKWYTLPTIQCKHRRMCRMSFQTVMCGPNISIRLITIITRPIRQESIKHNNSLPPGWKNISVATIQESSERSFQMERSERKVVMFIIRKEQIITICCTRTMCSVRTRTCQFRDQTASSTIICPAVFTPIMDCSTVKSRQISTRATICASRADTKLRPG